MSGLSASLVNAHFVMTIFFDWPATPVVVWNLILYWPQGHPFHSGNSSGDSFSAYFRPLLDIHVFTLGSTSGPFPPTPKMLTEWAHNDANLSMAPCLEAL